MLTYIYLKKPVILRPLLMKKLGELNKNVLENKKNLNVELENEFLKNMFMIILQKSFS